MPIYEYKCKECGQRFEKFVRSSCGDQEIACPNCQSQSVEQQVSMFGRSGSLFSGGGYWSSGGG